jgi:hypothetical protein
MEDRGDFQGLGGASRGDIGLNPWRFCMKTKASPSMPSKQKLACPGVGCFKQVNMIMKLKTASFQGESGLNSDGIGHRDDIGFTKVFQGT